MRALGLPWLGRLADAAPLVLRLGLGIVFLAHGLQKLTNGPEMFAGTLAGLGVPAPEVVAWLMTVAEAGGGLLLLLGLLTRLTTLPLIGIMVGAIALVKVDVGVIAPPDASGAGAEVDIALLVGLVGLLLLGPGRLSLDSALRIEPNTVATVATRTPA